MMGGMSVLVVVVRAVCAGCVCAAQPLLFCMALMHKSPNNRQTTAYWGSLESSQ